MRMREIWLCGIGTDVDEMEKVRKTDVGTLLKEKWPHFARNEIGINHGRLSLSLIIIKLDHARWKEMGGQRPVGQIQHGNCVFSYVARKFRALMAVEIIFIISRAILKVFVLAEKASRSEQRWVAYLDCSPKLLATRVENLHEIWSACGTHLWRTPSVPRKTFWRGPWLFSRLRRFICIERCTSFTLFRASFSRPGVKEEAFPFTIWTCRERGQDNSEHLWKSI